MPQRVKPAEQGIVLDALSAGYGQTLIVDDINLTIPTGKMTVLAGANGSGKSTLLSTIARMLKPLGGCVRLDGQAIHQMPTKAVSRQLGILPQSPLTPEGLTVFELVSRGRYPWQGLMRQWSEADELAVEEALRLTVPPNSPICRWTASPAASVSAAGSPWRWPSKRPPFCSMSRPPGSICAIRSISSSCSRPSPANMAARW